MLILFGTWFYAIKTALVRRLSHVPHGILMFYLGLVGTVGSFIFIAIQSIADHSQFTLMSYSW